MKTCIHLVATAVLAATLHGAESPKPAPERGDRKELRVISGPGERRMMLHRGEGGEVEKETVAFLGVETGPVSPTMSAQLGIQRGTGLVVNHIVPKSPAADVLQQHDVLLKLDDQILIETRQLSVLIQNKKENDEVTLTYMRAGKQATAKVKLGKHEVPKVSFSFAPAAAAFAFGTPPERFDFLVPSGDGEREEVDRVLSLLEQGRGSPDGPPGFIPRAPRIFFEAAGKQGMRAISVNTGDSHLVYKDDEGVLKLTIARGGKTLVAKGTKGEEQFSGAVNTPEEREALPSELRARLEKLESMYGVTFQTDGDFRGAETKTLRPRGIVFPVPGPEPRVRVQPPRRPKFL